MTPLEPTAAPQASRPHTRPAPPPIPLHTPRYVEYCMSRVELLLSAGLVPVLVFDGGRLPNKGEEEASRGRSRAAAREKARALAAAGNVAGAYEAYQRAVDVSPWHALQLIAAARRRGVDYVVAPYEADAQMAHMATTGGADLVVSEDSDMLAYGCPLVRLCVGVFWGMVMVGTGSQPCLRPRPGGHAVQRAARFRPAQAGHAAEAGGRLRLRLQPNTGLLPRRAGAVQDGQGRVC